ncbi:hypothetical protein AN216_10510 [Streptomyces oceani]|uniref:Uncharacterized protein n=1 Tax=Streptomyces oceani TaxID=1075402 RepID=A0A1E7KIF4_9ACTN|nr:hypothetical protein AN216_10510 [Streptomyces oceani]
MGPYVEIDRVRSSARHAGAMSGGLTEWLALALSSGFSTASLVYSHLAFRASLPPAERSAVRLVVEHGDSQVVVEAGSAEEAAQLANLITNSGLLSVRSGQDTGQTGSPSGGDGSVS